MIMKLQKLIKDDKLSLKAYNQFLIKSENDKFLKYQRAT